jgi:HAE1 family hydrophobic/amphiphilic exporter-1
VRRALAELAPPEGLSARMAGQTETQEKTFSDLSLAGAVALMLVFMVLASQFQSLRAPLVVLFSVPLGISGVLAPC